MNYFNHKYNFCMFIKSQRGRIILVGIALTMLLIACKKEDNTPSNIVKDIDGNIYTSVTIGTQIWLCENLKTTRLNDGTAIPLVTDNAEWQALSSIEIKT